MALAIAAALLLGFLAAAPLSTGRRYWGALIGTQFTGTQPPWSWQPVTDFANLNAGGKPLSILAWGSPYYSLRWCKGYCRFQTSLFTIVRRHGVIPWLLWGSDDADSSTAAAYTDAQIAAGSQDAYIVGWARAAKSWGHPFFLRFDWEMNLAKFPWGVGADGNTASDYVAMWRHVHRIFSRVGATNVSWVWCPNIDPTDSRTSLASLYPGDRYVDWTCLDGYNGGDPWQSFATLFGSAYNRITSTIAPSKPMIVGEVGSTESGGSKAQWIKSMFAAIETSFTRIRGLLWYNAYSNGPSGHRDWPLETSHASEAAFTAAIDRPQYTGNSYRNLGRSPIPPPS